MWENAALVKADRRARRRVDDVSYIANRRRRRRLEAMYALAQQQSSIPGRRRLIY